jgi:hypothetical protein
MFRVKDPVFAMDESFFLDGGSRLENVDVRSLTSVSEWRSVAASIPTVPDVGRYRPDALRSPMLACGSFQRGNDIMAPVGVRDADRRTQLAPKGQPFQ